MSSAVRRKVNVFKKFGMSVKRIAVEMKRWNKKGICE